MSHQIQYKKCDLHFIEKTHFVPLHHITGNVINNEKFIIDSILFPEDATKHCYLFGF